MRTFLNPFFALPPGSILNITLEDFSSFNSGGSDPLLINQGADVGSCIMHVNDNATLAANAYMGGAAGEPGAWGSAI